jgi:hypothetical protein
MSHFLSDNLHDHLAEISKRLQKVNRLFSIDYEFIDYSTLCKLHDKAKYDGLQSVVIDISISIYIKSADFNTADNFFNTHIFPWLDETNRDQILALISGIEANHQTSDRRKASSDHRLIKERCDLLFENNFDYSSFPNFSYRAVS